MNQEQQSKKIKRNYLVSEELMLEKPQVVDFLDYLDQQVIDFAREQRMNELELRRLVMGKIGFDELTQRDRKHFFRLKEDKPTSDWHGLVALESQEDGEFSFKKMGIVKRKYDSLKDDSLEDGGELRARLEEIKAKKDKEKQEGKAAKEKEKNLPRVKMYKSDIEELGEMSTSIGVDHRQHIIIIGVNESLNKQFTNPRFTHCNTGK